MARGGLVGGGEQVVLAEEVVDHDLEEREHPVPVSKLNERLGWLKADVVVGARTFDVKHVDWMTNRPGPKNTPRAQDTGEKSHGRVAKHEQTHGRGRGVRVERSTV